MTNNIKNNNATHAINIATCVPVVLLLALISYNLGCFYNQNKIDLKYKDYKLCVSLGYEPNICYKKFFPEKIEKQKIENQRIRNIMENK